MLLELYFIYDMGYRLNSILWKGTELRRFYYFSVLLKPTHGTGVNATYHNNLWLVLYFYLAFQVTSSDIKIHARGGVTHKCIFGFSWVELNWLFNVTINDISVIYVTAHRCAGGLKKFDLRSGSQRHRHFVGFFNVPVLAPTRDQPFYTVIPTHRPI